MDEAELKQYRRRVEQVRGRLESLIDNFNAPGRVDAHLARALAEVRNALKQLDGQPTSAAG